MDKDQNLEEENTTNNTSGETVNSEQPTTPETEAETVNESEAEAAEPELPSKVRIM